MTTNSTQRVSKMEEEVIKKYKAAGEIAKEVKKLAREIVKPGAKYYEICQKLEDRIIKLGGKPAFPVNISVNEIAAHDTAKLEDDREIKKEDLVKVDIGVHVDGFIADTAISFCWTDEYKDLIKASEEALKAAIDTLKPGIKLSKIGGAIEKTIASYGYRSIRNLSGHGLGQFDLHHGLTIPNYDNGSDKTLEPNIAIAIEPFATNGNGFIIETKNSEIFKVENIPPLRTPNARKLFSYIVEEYKTLPFAKRWLTTKFNKFQIASGFIELKRYLHNYPNLKEEADGIVSQAEHTILVLDSGNIITT